MKKTIGVMLFMFFMMSFGSGVFIYYFHKTVGGQTEELFLYPIYGGIVLLSGIITLGFCIISDEISEVKKKLENMEKKECEDNLQETADSTVDQ